MRPSRIQLKLYAEPETLPDPERVVPVFHAWIRDRVLSELLVDVARYGHLHQGPAVILIGAEADYAVDLGEDRPGLLVTRKRGPESSDALEDVLRRAFQAASLLENRTELRGLAFRTDELLLVIPDRLSAPNDDAAFAELAPGIREVASRWLGPISLEREGDARQPFTLRIRREEHERLERLFDRRSTS